MSFTIDKEVYYELKNRFLKKGDRSKFVTRCLRDCLMSNEKYIRFMIKQKSTELEYWKYRLTIQDIQK